MDPKKETQHLDKHDELAANFDYTHSQVNELKDTPPPVPETKKPVNAVLFNPKYWLTIVAVIVIYLLIISYLTTLLSYVLFVIMLVITWRAISVIQRRGSDEPLESDKFKMVVLMTFEPLVGQALYYYRLRRTMPHTASIALKIGWQVFILYLAAVAIYTFITVTGSWQYHYGAQFQTHLDAITGDMNTITQNAKEFDSVALQKNCKKISADIVTTKETPPYPNATIQGKVMAALTEIDQGAKDCDKSIASQDPELLKSANAGLNQGYHDLRTAVNLMRI